MKTYVAVGLEKVRFLSFKHEDEYYRFETYTGGFYHITLPFLYKYEYI
jgi:hypothetical protein